MLHSVSSTPLVCARTLSSSEGSTTALTMIHLCLAYSQFLDAFSHDLGKRGKELG